MSEMADFTTVLRSMTQGRGSFILKFERYEQLPSNLEAQVIEEDQSLGRGRIIPPIKADGSCRPLCLSKAPLQHREAGLYR